MAAPLPSLLDHHPNLALASLGPCVSLFHLSFNMFGSVCGTTTALISQSLSAPDTQTGGGIGEDDWESTAGGESGWIAPKPGDSEIVFGGSMFDPAARCRALELAMDVLTD